MSAFFSLLSRRPWLRGVLAAALTVAIWSSFVVVSRLSVDPARGAVLNSFDLLYCRIWGSALILLPWAWWWGRRDRSRASCLWGLSPLSWTQTWRVGIPAGVLYGALSYSGFMYAPAAHASVLLSGSLPLWTALLAMLVLAERLTPMRIVGLVLIALGDVLVGGPSFWQAGSGSWRGDVLFVAASMVWATYTIVVRRGATEAIRTTMAVTAFAFVAYVPVYTLLLLGGVVHNRLVDAGWGPVLAQLLMQGVASVVVAGIAYNKMIQYFGPVRSTMITSVVPGLSALGAVVVLGEALHWNLIAGLVLVSAGIVFGVRAAAPRGPMEKTA